jgi:hypothetical protein
MSVLTLKDQRLEAIKLANAARLKASDLKRQIRDRGARDGAKMLADAIEREDPEYERIRLYWLIHALYRCGPERALRLLRLAQVNQEACAFQLSAVQRKRLVFCLRWHAVQPNAHGFGSLVSGLARAFPEDTPTTNRSNMPPQSELHPAQEAVLHWFSSSHLTNTNAKAISQAIGDLADRFAHDLASSPHGAEVTTGLRKLLEAKDCFVRAALY